ncbi:amidase domain-containing protein [Streptomyces californicus]|uniref:amidase domain-containing protein n=1 Tax=Streptomyces californicus TaxID=67351 RepID=UPI00296EB1B1|nr:amidase domain-containing protein [Streptomyces californicus]MDW4914714.1 amidase domain-containing protein [Streptomyces californicus]
MALALGVTLLTALSPAATAHTAESAATQTARTVGAETVHDFAALADTVLTRRTSALLDGPQQLRRNATALPLKGGVHVTSRLAHAEDTATEVLQDRKERLADLDEAYTAAETEVDIDEMRVAGDRATVQITETTTLTYKKIRGDEPPTTGFQAKHELSFVAGLDGSWELAGFSPKEEAGPAAVNAVADADENSGPVGATEAPADDDGEPEPDGPAPQETQAGTAEPTVQAQVKPSVSASYKYSEMAKYAEKYWKNYNTSYRRFNDVGGDCTNFISQALRAGGWKNDTGYYKSYKNWWYNSANQTTSWVNVNYWASFALYSGRTYNLDNVYKLGIGDILQMDFTGNRSKDHSMITTYKSGGVPYLTYHSTNTYRKSVKSLVAQNPRATYYAFRT